MSERKYEWSEDLCKLELPPLADVLKSLETVPEIQVSYGCAVFSPVVSVGDHGAKIEKGC